MLKNHCGIESVMGNAYILNNIKNIQKEILTYIELGKKDELTISIDNLFDKIYLDETLTIDCIKIICIDIIVLTCDLLSHIDGVIFDYEVKFILCKQLLKNKAIQEFHKWMLDELTAAAEWRSVVRNKSTTTIAKRMKHLIDTRYNENITSKMLAEEFYLTSNYISLIFKREMGENFLAYLTKVRIDKAKDLIKDSKLKIYDIAHMVGYDDVDYFSKIFKKHCKIKPTEYRRQLL